MYHKEQEELSKTTIEQCFIFRWGYDVPSFDRDQTQEHDEAKEEDAQHIGDGDGRITVSVQERSPPLHSARLQVCTNK